MRTSELRTFFLLFVAIAAAACAGPTVTPDAPAPAETPDPTVEQPAAATDASESITAEDMYDRIYFLASDGLQGRDTPSPGLEAAAAYLVSEFRRMGLEPGGDDGSFYQRWPYPLDRATGEAVEGEELSYPPNVAAVLPGNDPELRDEYVILSAHFDHLGVGEAVDGDSIFNGADDNASGTAALLEIADAMMRLPESDRPRRSVMFLPVSGEEKGLLGSRWFSDNPTVPLESIVANINIDMIAGDQHTDSVVIIGKEYSDLGDLVDGVNADHPELNLVTSDDLWPEQRFFFRSDHFNFARREIPALFFFTGVHECYHQLCDNADFVDPDKAARIARLIFHATREIADRDERPEWDEDGLAEVREMVTGM